MNALCLLCRQPDRIWCEFLNNFNHYKIYLMIDNFNFDTSELQEIYSNISFIKISDSLCEKYNYTDINYFVNKKITSWEKALLYFQFINRNHEFVWFIEDDAFFYDEQVLKNIDNQYQSEDLLTNQYFDIGERKEKWGPIHKKLSEPWLSAMCCVVRMSKVMMNELQLFTEEMKQFCFLEILFPTLAVHKKINYKHPKELLSIRFNPDMAIRKKVKSDYLYTNIFHPVKDIYKHKIYREGILH